MLLGIQERLEARLTMLEGGDGDTAVIVVKR